MGLAARLESAGRKYLPAWAARRVKLTLAGSRYRRQRARARRGFADHGHRYRQHLLFIAGLPKSGTTWLERMISSYPGFTDVLIPDVAPYEIRTGGSHDYDVPEDMFDRFERMLVLTKMHVHGSPHNVDVLHKAGVRHVVLYRDLRDVAVSSFFYVSRTPWHPEYPVYRRLELAEGLAVFAERTLPAYAAWIRSWERNRDPERSLVIRYEEMLADAAGALTRMAELFELDSTPERVRRIVDEHSFARLSGGRSRGQGGAGWSFFRKGVAGDWRNHFTPALVDLYKPIIGEVLIEAGYERDLDWERGRPGVPGPSAA